MQVQPQYSSLPTFYLFTLEELNSTMGHCELSIYGEALYQHLLVHPRRTIHSKVAKLGVMPPFMAYEMHWPWYNVPKHDNMARTGTDCYTATVVEAQRLFGEYSTEDRLSSGFFITLVDLDPYWFHEMDSALYSDPMFSWAKLNTMVKHWRPHRDISMPPPATERLMRYKFDMRDKLKKKYWLTFKGRFATHPIRAELAKLNNATAGILILDSSDEESNGYDYDELMSSSMFTLVVRGDREYSYRFTEAVCSGAVPVLLADGWVAPFSTLVPFQTYGIQIQEQDWQDLVPRLLSIDNQEWLNMQDSALTFCHSSLVSVHHQFDTMINLLLSENIH